eukprot:ANDGO_00602.mRNA.1 hypothetical protein
MSHSKVRVDGLVLCALAEEARHFADVARETYKNFRNSSETAGNINYVLLEIPQNATHTRSEGGQRSDRVVRLAVVTCFREGGGNCASFLMSTIQQEFDFDCVLMPGICAGAEGEMRLGDVLLVEKAVSVTEHVKESQSADGTQHHAADVEPVTVSETFRQKARVFADSKTIVDALRQRPLHRDISSMCLYILKCSQEEMGPVAFEEAVTTKAHELWDPHSLSVSVEDALNFAFIKLEKNRYGLSDNESGRFVVTDKGNSFYQAHLEKVSYMNRRKFPFHDTPLASIVCGTMMTAPGVRADLSPEEFARLRSLLGARKAMGLDMEIHDVYRAAKSLGKQFIAAKGVSDFGTSWKDDIFHPAASRNSAFVLLMFASSHLDCSQRGTSAASSYAILDEVLKEIRAGYDSQPQRLLSLEAHPHVLRYAENNKLAQQYVATVERLQKESAVLRDLQNRFGAEQEKIRKQALQDLGLESLPKQLQKPTRYLKDLSYGTYVLQSSDSTGNPCTVEVRIEPIVRFSRDNVLSILSKDVAKEVVMNCCTKRIDILLDGKSELLHLGDDDGGDDGDDNDNDDELTSMNDAVSNDWRKETVEGSSFCVGYWVKPSDDGRYFLKILKTDSPADCIDHVVDEGALQAFEAHESKGTAYGKFIKGKMPHL